MKRILHIPGCRPSHTSRIEDACGTIVRWLSTVPGVEQRVFRSAAPRYPDRLRSEIRRFRPDFVHFHAPDLTATVSILAILPDRVKLIVHWHADIAGRRPLHTFVRPLEAALLRRANVIVVTDPHRLEASAALEPFRAKCVVVPTVVDTGRLIPRGARVEQIRWRYGESPLLLFTGRDTLQEGIEVMLAAVERVGHDCRLVVGGEGPSTGRLRDGNTSERISFVGAIPADDLAAWYTAADIFLLPALSCNEAFAPELAEAMWCGTPAVTFTVPGSGINWVNQNGVTGIEVDNGNTGQFAAAIDHLLAHDDMRYEYGENARRRVEENMTLGRVVPALEALYC